MSSFILNTRSAFLLLLVACLLSTSYKSQAQTAASYGYSQLTGTYADIVGGTLTGAGILTDDGSVGSIPIGFPFVFCGTTYNNLAANANGYVSLANNTVGIFTNSQANVSSAGWLMPYWDDLYGVGGYSSYITTGTSPNRIFTLEWKSWGFFPSTTPIFSFQLKLYETTNVIQFWYKPIAATPGHTATIGIANSTTDFQTLSNATATATSSSATFNVSIPDIPVLNQVYQFAPPVPCNGAPTVTANIPASVCPNQNFTMSVSSTPPMTGLAYLWEWSANGTTGWTNFSTTATATHNINTPTWYRVTVTCTNTNTSVTTTPQQVLISNFLTCYCTPTYANGGTADNIVNVVLQALMNNTTAAGNPAPYYKDYTLNQPSTLAIPQLILGTVDTVKVTMGGDPNQYCAVWIDYDRNGVFNTNEYFTLGTNSGANGLHKIPIFTPLTASPGLSRMRIRGGDDAQMNATQPCGPTNSGWGESEDYYVQIGYPACTGPADAGLAHITDTAMCPDYTFVIWDTSHFRFASGLVWSWEQTQTAGNTWTAVPNSTNKDSVTLTFAASSWYRMRMICTYTNDTTYSNTVKVSLKPAYKCYTVSIGGGGNTDSSDIGAFTIGNFANVTGGPHVLNPEATRGRSDYTDLGPIELYTDSTYEVSVYHTMRSATHADAYITMFIDYNNNLLYDLPQEAIYLQTPSPAIDWLTTQSDWYVINNIRIPKAVIPNTPTGLRIVLNNDVTSPIASLSGAGTYTSGETEDYTVIFRRKPLNSIGNTIKGLDDIGLYPNPTNGNFTISFTAAQGLRDVQVTITDVTGRAVKNNSYGDVQGKFEQQMDLSTEAKGVYFVIVKADGQKMTQRIVVK